MLQRNLALHTDLYLPRWMYIYWKEGRHNERAVFDVYYRSNPFEGGYVVFAGLENIIEYIQTLRFTEEDITYLQEMIGFPDEFKDELRQFKFNGSISSVKEGEIVFPNEPLIRIEARIFEAKLLQTAILNIANHESLIATKYARIRQSAPRAKFLEAGARRAQGIDAAYFGTRASYLLVLMSQALLQQDATSVSHAAERWSTPTFNSTMTN